MTSALYLEHYLDGLEHLPNELKRNFTLMRDLDTRAQSIMKQIDSEASEFMKNIVTSKENITEDDKKTKMKTIQDLFCKAKEFGDDKVQLAIQTYELVDKHIRRLDSDLARFECEIQDKTLSSRGKSEENVGKKGGRKKTKDAKGSGKNKKRSLSTEDDRDKTAGISGQGKSNSKKTKVTQEKETRKNQKKAAEPEEIPVETHPSDVLDMPVDPNEPTYCLCHQVSYGEMIGCDNPDCPIEWFHFSCVGLSIKPKGKWYCPKCSQDRKKK